MKTAIALGTFDGLHKGHIAVLNSALLSDYTPVAVTFIKPPKSYFSGDIGLLMSPEFRKAELIKMGFDRVHFIEFEEFRNLEATAFLDYLKDEFDPALILCGFNYRFGKGGKGDTEFLSKYCDENGIEVKVVSAVTFDGEVVSSTNIRGALLNGDLEHYKKMCGRNFSFTAPVVHGDERGRTIGFPTANQYYPKNLAKVKFGVYKSQVTVDGKKYRGMTNIGIRPTFLSNDILCETYILDFSEQIYAKEVKLELLEFIREERKFSSIDELKSAIENDVEKC